METGMRIDSICSGHVKCCRINTSMKHFLICLFTTLTAHSVLAEPPPRPNILYFYVDDLGWGSIGPNGQAERKAKGLPFVRTPNIDALAAKGINFTRGYGCHVCSPARSSQQTGFHQGHTFADRNDPDNAKKAIRTEDITMGDALRAAGYTTGYWGKWGYGGSAEQKNPTIDNIQTLPTSHGYQHVLAELHHVRAHTFFQPTLWSAPAKGKKPGGLELVPNSMKPYAGNDRYPDDPAKQNHPKYPETAYCDDLYAFAALDFVRDNAKAFREEGRPFFGLLAVQIPHAPFDEISQLPLWDEAYKDDPHFADLPPQAKQWAAMVTRIDAHFGNILAALEDPNGDGDSSDSIADQTLVLFQSDNGGPGGANNSVFDANGGLRGNKGKIEEGGIRVPLVMRWPGKIHADSDLKAGTDCDRVVDVTDLLPTFCELAGARIPLGVDGVSIAPLLSGEGKQQDREFIIHEAGNGKSIIRGNHKLVLNSKGGNRNKKKEPAAGFTLYDLSKDHAEKNDIGSEHPELVTELSTLLLGERVNEPKGFSNTYHQWTGKNGANTSNPENWSDYVYENAGITYQTDNGPPHHAWVARIENRSKESSVAKADVDLEVLGLEIQGNSKAAVQTLHLDRDVGLVGRNEIRIAEHGSLVVDGGTVSSLRALKILPEGALTGHGTIDSSVLQEGLIAIGASKNETLKVNGSLEQESTAQLEVSLLENDNAPILVSGNAKLGGTLAVTIPKGFAPESEQSFSVISAASIKGTFSNSEVETKEGHRFEIRYSEKSVSLVRK